MLVTELWQSNGAGTKQLRGAIYELAVSDAWPGGAKQTIQRPDKTQQNELPVGLSHSTARTATCGRCD
jgi:hypothetical protein